MHSRGANASGFKAEGLARDAENAVPPGAHIRTDIDVPVLDLQTEGDMVALRAHLTHQPPFAHYRRWEIAGAAHAETPRWVAGSAAAARHGTGLQGSGEQRAASRGREGGAERADPMGARRRRAAAVAGDRARPDPAAPDPIVRDAHGNAKGGIRLPEVEAPTATLDGGANTMAQEPAPGGARTSASSSAGRSRSTRRRSSRSTRRTRRS